MIITKEEIKAMSAMERTELLNAIWDIMEDEPYTDELGAESKEELNILHERLEAYKRDPSSAKTWDETYRGLKNRKNDL